MQRGKKAEPSLPPRLQTRTRKEIPWSEFERTLNQALNTLHLNQSQIIDKMGFTGGVFSSWRQKGRAPVWAKYILDGFLLQHEKEQSKSLKGDDVKDEGIVFTTDQIEALVYALRSAQSEQLKGIRAGLLRELLRRVEER